jgi:phosphohistidine phosphatase SixA
MKKSAAICLILLCGLVSAASAEASEQLWALLKKPGHIVLLRHSNAPVPKSETYDTDIKDCSTQRNLDQAGKAQAARIGDAFRKHGIRQVRLFASEYCRTLDTAKLMGLGPVTPLPILNQVVYSNPLDLREAGIKARQFMKTIPARQLTVLVSHVSNIHSIAGVVIDSGEMAIVHFDPSGELVVDGRILVP